MTPYGLEDLFKANPTQAFQVTLTGGDKIIVDNPSRALILDLQLYVGQADDPNSLVGKSLRVVSIPNIALVEPIDRSKLYRNGRRVRR